MNLLVTVVVGGFHPSGKMTCTNVLSEFIEFDASNGGVLDEHIRDRTELMRKKSELLSDAQIKMVLSVSHCVLP